MLLVAGTAAAMPQRTGPATPVPTTSRSMYNFAVRLASGMANPFRGFSLSSRTRLINRAGSMLLQPSTTQRPAVSTKISLNGLMGRAAASAVLLKAADAGGGGDKAKTLGRVLDSAEQEPHRGMSGLLYLNLHARERFLAAADKARLGKLRARVLPESPEYDKLNLSQGWHESMTVHEEFWRDTLAEYRADGFAIKPLSADKVVATKIYHEPGHAPFPVEVTMEKGEVDLLRDGNKARVVSITYDGHSALGGNVSMSILTAPRALPGPRMACFFMCRGTQNLEELRRHLGDQTHIITSSTPSTQGDDTAVRFALYKMLARRGTYAYARREAGSLGTKYIWPDSIEKLELVDADLDGVQDAAGRNPGTVDVLFNVGRRAGYRAARNDMTPHAPGVPVHQLDGDKLMRGVAFANTVLTYHAEESPSPVHSVRKVKDRFVAAGFFEGPATEVVRLVRRGSKIGVQVNALYSEQSRDALGALIVYEITKQIAPRGSDRKEQVLRPFVFASTYVHYMTPYQETCDDVITTLAKRAGLPATLDYGKMEKVIESDGHGYATNKHVAELQRLLGAN